MQGVVEGGGELFGITSAVVSIQTLCKDLLTSKIITGLPQNLNVNPLI